MSARRNVLYLFDVDGTLTRPRETIEGDLLQFLLDKVVPVVHVGLVSGSDFRKVTEQMGGELNAFQFDYLFFENGLVYYKNSEFVSKESILQKFSEQQLQSLINFSLCYLSKLEIPCKRGNFIEFRSGMINICPVGRSCNAFERQQFTAYDKEHGVRENMVRALRKEFDGLGLQFSVGGQISIDVFPVGWDKTHCLTHVREAGFDEIHFFGDRVEPGGNDHEIYSHPQVIGHKVTSPDDTKAQLIKCLNVL